MSPAEQTSTRYSVIFPARNEEERIGKALEVYEKALLEWAGSKVEMIVVANACTDRTPEVVEELAATRPHLRLINLSLGGKGRAILEGFRQASGDFAIFCDPADVIKLLQIVEQSRADCAMGSRWLPDSVVPVRQPWRRRLASRMFNLAVRLIFGFRYKDTQCGAKAFNRKAAEIIVQNVQSTGYHFDCDVLWQLKRKGLTVEEVPITWRDQGGSGIQVGRDGLKMLWGLLKIRFRGAKRGEQS